MNNNYFFSSIRIDFIFSNESVDKNNRYEHKREKKKKEKTHK